MNLKIIGAAAASVLLGFATQSPAQSAADSGKTFTHGESKRCESMSGTDKAQCDREEATKTQGPAASDNRSGSSSAAGSSGKTFTHGESKRCESLSGADKDQCDKEEATKTEGQAGRELSAPRPEKE
jgi:hypothetical protein